MFPDALVALDSPLALPWILAVAAGCGALLLAVSPFFRRILAAEDASPARYPMLDGLRGQLALSVLVFHAYAHYLSYRWGITGNANQNPFFVYLGMGGVAQFFLITGFLFWGKAIENKVDILNHYYSRAWRIGPLFLTVTLAALLFVGVQSGWTLRVKPLVLVGQVASFLLLGALPTIPVNGIDTIMFFGPAWTLRYEWRFYLFLPFMAVIATPRRFFATLAVLLVSFVVIHFCGGDRLLGNNRHYALFLVGMLCAHLVRRFPSIPLLKAWWVSLLMLVPAGLAAWVGEFSPFWAILNGLFFLPVIYGNSFFGILRSRPLRALGAISYSVYLLHGSLLRGLLLLLRHFGYLQQLSPVEYWGIIALFTLPLIAFCALTYRLIEYPHLHKRLSFRVPFAYPPRIDVVVPSPIPRGQPRPATAPVETTTP